MCVKWTLEERRIRADLIGVQNAESVLKLSRNAPERHIPALFGKAERHTGTSGNAGGGTLG